jgi:hypothetical protein
MGITSAAERVEFVTDMMSHITLTGSWSDTIALNVHALTKDKCDNKMDNFYKDYSVHLINTINTAWKFCLDISM